ncbi:MAG TPA: Gfo/Idh/MocA family oxidoreductase, partial [Chloroflexota bacterium]
MSPPVLRVGVVGLGEIAQYMHLPHLTSLPNIKVTAMCDLSPSLVEQVADKYGVAKRYTRYLDLLEQRDVDAVFVATRDHPPVSIAAAEAGKHVMSEKPIAFNLEEADAVIAAARQNKVKLQIAYMKRYDPAFEWALPRFRAMQAVGRL